MIDEASRREIFPFQILEIWVLLVSFINIFGLHIWPHFLPHGYLGRYLRRNCATFYQIRTKFIAHNITKKMKAMAGFADISLMIFEGEVTLYDVAQDIGQNGILGRSLTLWEWWKWVVESRPPRDDFDYDISFAKKLILCTTIMLNKSRHFVEASFYLAKYWAWAAMTALGLLIFWSIWHILYFHRFQRVTYLFLLQTFSR